MGVFFLAWFNMTSLLQKFRKEFFLASLFMFLGSRRNGIWEIGGVFFLHSLNIHGSWLMEGWRMKTLKDHVS